MTFYFTQEILPSLASSGKSLGTNGVADSVGMDSAIKFVHVYGSYLWLHLSLVYASALKANIVIENLLALAKHDPRHKEVMKELSRDSSLILYEPVRNVALRLHHASFVSLTSYLLLIFLLDDVIRDSRASSGHSKRI